MSLSHTCIRRPVLATVLNILIVVFGALGFTFLGIREYPAVDPPVVTVTTSYAGANSEIISAQITEPIEAALSGIAGIRTLSSTSREGQSSIRVEFNLGADLETAANDVRDKMSQVVKSLPADADPPVVQKADANSDPIIFLAVQSETKNVLEVSNIASTLIKERVQTIPGVSDVRIFGERKYAMRIFLDPDKMVAHRITPQDVFSALDAQNVDLPAGRIEGDAVDLSLRAEGRLGTPEQFENIVLREADGRQIHLGDVGRVELAAENPRSGLRSQGIPMVGVAVIPQPNSNAVAIADEFLRRLEIIKKVLPPEYKIDIGYDFTRFVRRSILEVEETLAIAFLLVAGVIIAFLRDWRSAIVPIIAIPISIVVGFFVMYIAGYSINILTLVSLVLAIGLVCDDAIVVLENIYAKVERGIPPLRAAFTGTDEIYFAVISTTITLAAVFVPIIFLEGLTGRLFREFAVVLVGCVLTSAFVSLTLSPMMCRYLLRPDAHTKFFYRTTEPFFRLLNKTYRASLLLFLRMRYAAIPLLGVVVAATVYYTSRLQRELAPMEDRSNIRINVVAAEGSSFDYTQDQLRTISETMEARYPNELHRAFAIAGGNNNAANTGSVNMYLKEPYERSRTAFEILKDVSRDVESFTGVRALPAMPPTIGDRRAGQPVQFVLQATNFDALAQALPKFLEAAAKRPELRFIDSDLKTNRPQASVEIDRPRAAELGVSVREIARALQLALGDTRYGYFIKDGRQYQVMGQLDRASRNDPSALERLHVRADNGQMVPLGSVAKLREFIGPAAIYRYDRYVSATVSAGLNPGYALGDGIRAMNEVAAATLPKDFATSLAGQARDFADSSSSLLYAFILALIVIYLVLAAQFESWIDPFVIMLTVPLSLGGAVATLYYTGQTLNIFSQIGIIMLIGLVTKNGILIVEFANQRKAEGLDVANAVAEAALARFRPILMTSIATILGILPIALQLGGAAGSRRSLGIAVVGGMTIATVLTLYVVPAVYSMLSREHRPEEADAPTMEDETATPDPDPVPAGRH